MRRDPIGEHNRGGGTWEAPLSRAQRQAAEPGSNRPNRHPRATYYFAALCEVHLLATSGGMMLRSALSALLE
jgi:hypothetical protein